MEPELLSSTFRELDWLSFRVGEWWRLASQRFDFLGADASVFGFECFVVVLLCVADNGSIQGVHLSVAAVAGTG